MTSNQRQTVNHLASALTHMDALKRDPKLDQEGQLAMTMAISMAEGALEIAKQIVLGE